LNNLFKRIERPGSVEGEVCAMPDSERSQRLRRRSLVNEVGEFEQGAGTTFTLRQPDSEAAAKISHAGFAPRIAAR
jgi:hypothetical protein